MKFSLRMPWLGASSVLLATAVFGLALRSGQEVPHGTAVEVESSSEDRAAARAVTTPEGFKAQVIASSPALQNPVAFDVDELNRFFVVESFRLNNGVVDMRSHMDWLEEELAIQQVAQRLDMMRRHTPPESFEERWTSASERIVRLVDSTGDGLLDQRTVFAEDFDAPEDGVAAGILASAGPEGESDVWFACIPALYQIWDADGDGVSDGRRQHSTGYGLRFSLTGHDLHGLTVGPDLRLYFSIGDRGFNVVTREGKRLVGLGMGAVLRCELDGSGLEVFCNGLRNPQELAFDDWGNLFTADNNSDAGDKARWTVLLEGSDSGWRQAYQWVEVPNARGPWLGEELWKPHFPGQLSYLLPPMANATDGPSGLVAYPGVGDDPSLEGSFLVCDFRGDAKHSGILRLKNAPDGAGFKLVENERYVWNTLPTDVDFGPDGAPT